MKKKRLTKVKNLEATQIWTEEEQVKTLIDFIDVKDWTDYNVIDPCAGIGNMLKIAYNQHPEAHYIGVEIDPDVFEKLKENTMYFSRVHNSDIEDVDLNDYDKSIVLLNPPYQNGNRSVYMEWIRYTLKTLKADKSAFIVPSRWMYGIYEKRDDSFIRTLYKHIDNIKLIRGEEVFHSVNVGEVVLFSVNDRVNETNSIQTLNLNGKIIYDDGMVGKIYNKMKSKSEVFFYDVVQNYNHSKTINTLVADKKLIQFDKSNGYFKGVDRMDGGPFDYIFVEEGETYRDDKFILELDNDINLDNLFNYLKSDLVNYLFSYLAVTKNSNILHYSMIPDIDFNIDELGDYTDEYLYKYFGLEQDEIDHINKELERFRESQENKFTKTRKKRINLYDLGIRNGERLTWIKDEEMTFTVVDASKNVITGGGDIGSLSKMAQVVSGVTRPLQGTLFFKYKGIPLSTLRKEYDKK